jgi:hypothetical protein
MPSRKERVVLELIEEFDFLALKEGYDFMFRIMFFHIGSTPKQQALVR